VAIAVFLVFVLYLGWDGGSLGHWLANAARWIVGLLAFALPVLLCYVAYVLVAPQEQRPRHGVSWGVGLIIVAVLLAAAGDAFGVFGGERPQRLFTDAYMSAHGGFTGELMWGGLSGIIGRLGVDVLVIALLLAGILLVTGASLRQWASRSRHGMAAAGRAARGQAEALGVRRRDSTNVLDADLDDATGALPDLALTGVLPVPEYEHTSVIHSARLIDGEQDAPDIFGGLGQVTDDPEPEPTDD
jgi:hypothetical protein